MPRVVVHSGGYRQANTSRSRDWRQLMRKLEKESESQVTLQAIRTTVCADTKAAFVLDLREVFPADVGDYIIYEMSSCIPRIFLDPTPESGHIARVLYSVDHAKSFLRKFDDRLRHLDDVDKWLEETRVQMRAIAQHASCCARWTCLRLQAEIQDRRERRANEIIAKLTELGFGLEVAFAREDVLLHGLVNMKDPLTPLGWEHIKGELVAYMHEIRKMRKERNMVLSGRYAQLFDVANRLACTQGPGVIVPHAVDFATMGPVATLIHNSPISKEIEEEYLEQVLIGRIPVWRELADEKLVGLMSSALIQVTRLDLHRASTFFMQAGNPASCVSYPQVLNSFVFRTNKRQINEDDEADMPRRYFHCAPWLDCEDIVFAEVKYSFAVNLLVTWRYPPYIKSDDMDRQQLFVTCAQCEPDHVRARGAISVYTWRAMLQGQHVHSWEVLTGCQALKAADALARYIELSPLPRWCTMCAEVFTSSAHWHTIVASCALFARPSRFNHGSAATMHTTDTYSKDVDATPPKDPKVFTVDPDLEVDVQKAQEPPHSEWAKAAAEWSAGDSARPAGAKPSQGGSSKTN
ncbi:hypothetical protein FISHEDRAFT_76439 [Fistulina hepatica ATCC 64428]|uniref:Uncharacterized protein n=1 Tax=Fistulina hepatica ATCC 64428 TaxID=1128425 RepID=A0A0D7A4C7_9AGAR|nr:hypothetical protein FISHEDRAFT_76439 [Fistulina hepatica ATCC 64428]